MYVVSLWACLLMYWVQLDVETGGYNWEVSRAVQERFPTAILLSCFCSLRSKRLKGIKPAGSK